MNEITSVTCFLFRRGLGRRVGCEAATRGFGEGETWRRFLIFRPGRVCSGAGVAGEPCRKEYNFAITPHKANLYRLPRWYLNSLFFHCNLFFSDCEHDKAIHAIRCSDYYNNTSSFVICVSPTCYIVPMWEMCVGNFKNVYQLVGIKDIRIV